MRIFFGFLALALALPAGPSLAQLQVTKRDCKRLAKHVPGPDVAYRPGGGTRGRKFAPADVGGTLPIKLPDVFEFDVNIDIRKYLGGPEADAAEAAADDAQGISDAAATASTTAAATAAAAADPTNTTKAAADAVTAAGTTAVISDLSDSADDTVSAAGAATVSSDANTALIQAYRDAQKYGAMNMSAGKVCFNMKTGFDL